jgi:hypothetical protein
MRFARVFRGRGDDRSISSTRGTPRNRKNSLEILRVNGHFGGVTQVFVVPGYTVRVPAPGTRVQVDYVHT